MRLFKRRPPTSTKSAEVSRLAELAASHSWQPLGDQPFDSGLTDFIFRLNFSLYDERQPLSTEATISTRVSTFRDVYGRELEGRRIVVANHSTNIGIIKLFDFKGVAVCAVELGTISPILLMQPRVLPPAVRHLPTVASGNPEFDAKFMMVLAPTVGPEMITTDVQQRIMVHDDWAFVGDDRWLACVSRGPFESADDVSRRLDEVMGIVHAFPRSVVPEQVDHSVDDLAARIDRISTVEDALAFLQQLSPEDRQRLAQSNTPLAPFADVTTPEQAMARLESLDVQQRMQLMAMFQRVEDH